MTTPTEDNPETHDSPTPSSASPETPSSRITLPLDGLISFDQEGIERFGRLSARFIEKSYRARLASLGEEIDTGSGVLRRLGYETDSLERAIRYLLKAEEALAVAEADLRDDAATGRAYRHFLARLGWEPIRARNQSTSRRRRRGPKETRDEEGEDRDNGKVPNG